MAVARCGIVLGCVTIICCCAVALCCAIAAYLDCRFAGQTWLMSWIPRWLES